VLVEREEVDMAADEPLLMKIEAALPMAGVVRN
jgi:hypothetical protein